MILAQNQIQALLLLVLGALCWGLWAATFKLAGKWRYELFYFDFAIGAGAAALIYAFTVGNLGFDGFSFMDDLMHAGKREWMFAAGAGVIFNLGNMVLMGAITVAGLSVAVPLGLGITLMFGVGLSVLLHHAGNPLLMFLGTACLLVAVVTIGVAYSFLISGRQDRLVQEGKVKTTSNIPGYSKGTIVSTNAPSSAKGLLLSIVSAALMWIMFPLISKARAGDQGLGPYALMALFALGVGGSTFLFNLFFINLPIEGEPLELFDYFKGKLKAHAIGWLAGLIWCTGMLANLVVAGGPPETQPGAAVLYAFQQGGVLVAALWGVLAWKDFHDGEGRVRAMVMAFLALFACGIVCLALSAKLGKV
jgi:glucose uptake protein